MKNITIILSIFLTITLLGCGDSKSDYDPNEIVLNLILNSRLKGMDPLTIRDQYSLMVTTQIMETMFQSHYLKRP